MVTLVVILGGTRLLTGRARLRALVVPTLLEAHSDVLYRPQRIDASSQVVASTLPDGLELNYGNGQLYGTPTRPGVYTIHLVGTDGQGRRAQVQLSNSSSADEGADRSAPSNQSI